MRRSRRLCVPWAFGVAWGIARVTFAQEAVSGPASPEPAGLLEIIFAGGIVGVTIMLVIIGLSLTAAYLVFEQWLTLRHDELIPPELAEQMRQSLAAGRPADGERLCHEQPSLLSFVLLAGLSEIEGEWPAVEKAVEDALAEQSARLFRRVEYLSVIGNIAPMVGLLGTVTGMIMTFHQVAVTRGAAGAPELAEGIYQALVTTVGGLVVAIPSLGAFAIFRNRIDQFIAEAAYQAQHAFSPLKPRKRKWKSGPMAPPLPP